MCTSVSASISKCVFGYGSLIPGRALWLGLELEGSRIGVLNIYTPTDLRRRVTYWRTLTELLPAMDSWIVGGDFNNLETMEDQQGRGPEFASIAHAEQSTWETFLFAVGGRDSWRDPAFRQWQGSLDYSWGFPREGGRLLERLDRFYVSDWDIGRGSQVEG